MLIKVLPESSFITAYEWTSKDVKNIEAVATARFNHPDAGEIDSYLKLCDPSSRSLVNELTGWLIAKTYGLPVPEYAFLAITPLSKLPQPLEGVARREFDAGNQSMVAFCTSSSRLPGVTPILMTDQLIAELKRWKYLHHCIAFDERCANPDRHANNLVRRGVGEFAAIDHGRLAWSLESPEWNVQSLKDSLAAYQNILAQFCCDKRTHHDCNLAISAAESLAKNVSGLLSELRHWWGILIPNDDDRNAWDQFLNDRLIHVELLLRKRFGMLV